MNPRVGLTPMRLFTRWYLDTRQLWETEDELLETLSLLPSSEKDRVLVKRQYSDRKTALGSLLLQRCYICTATGDSWLSVEIGRTNDGKPYSGNLHYNVSHVDGIVVLVGWTGPVGVDIVNRSLDSTILSQKDLESVFSAAERQNLAACGGNKEFNDLYNVNWTFKEAYMKYTGVPQWDSIASNEFRNIQIPKTTGECYMEAVPKSSIFIDGSNKVAFTECHNLFDTHFIAIYSPFEAVKEKTNTFEEKKLEDILPRPSQNT